MRSLYVPSGFCVGYPVSFHFTLLCALLENIFSLVINILSRASSIIFGWLHNLSLYILLFFTFCSHLFSHLPSRFVYATSVSLFQALCQWGRSKKRVRNERDLLKKKIGVLPRPLFRSSLLTESLEQAIYPYVIYWRPLSKVFRLKLQHVNGAATISSIWPFSFSWDKGTLSCNIPNPSVNWVSNALSSRVRSYFILTWLLLYRLPVGFRSWSVRLVLRLLSQLCRKPCVLQPHSWNTNSSADVTVRWHACATFQEPVDYGPCQVSRGASLTVTRCVVELIFSALHNTNQIKGQLE